MFAGIAALVAAAIAAATAIGTSVASSNKADKMKREAKADAERQARHEKRMHAIELLGGDSTEQRVDSSKDNALKKINQVDTSIDWAPIANSLGGVATAVGGVADKMPSTSTRTDYTAGQIGVLGGGYESPTAKMSLGQPDQAKPFGLVGDVPGFLKDPMTSTDPYKKDLTGGYSTWRY